MQHLVHILVSCEPQRTLYLFLIFKFQLCRVDAAESKRFMYNKGDFHGMREFLSSLIWEEEFADLNNDVNQQWSHLVHIIERELLRTRNSFLINGVTLWQRTILGAKVVIFLLILIL